MAIFIVLGLVWMMVEVNKVNKQAAINKAKAQQFNYPTNQVADGSYEESLMEQENA